jgi:transcriptional regulator with XRE-family HTH domain
LVNARKRQGHTQESLAHALNLEPSTVRRWERGTSDPMPLTWPRLAQELDIATDELVGFLAKPCCEKCGKVLAVDNTENLCGACRRDQHGQLDEPPYVGADFFDIAELQAAFESWHIGRVFRAYRSHPHFVGLFAKPLTQENLGRWLGLNQSQMSQQENGKAEQNLELLREWASILHLPQRMLWFDLPGQSRLRVTPEVIARPESVAFADLTTMNRDSGMERSRARDGQLLLRLAEQTAFGPAELLQASPQGHPVTEDDAAAIETATAMFRAWDNAQGGGLRRKAVIGQLADTTALLNGPFESSQAARRCFSAVADLAQLAGWMTWDLQYHATAQNYYLLGLAPGERHSL